MSNGTRQYPVFLLSALVLCLAVSAAFPFCRYYIDPDATSYLTIASRYAQGDLMQAVNGYWSPLTCWMTAIGIRAGAEPFTAALIVNTIGAVGFLGISNALFLRFDVLPVMVRWLNLSLVCFLATAVYIQSFTDLWECFLLLLALHILLSRDFYRMPGLWLAYGAVGALGYMAKAYALPFFMVSTLCCGYLIVKGEKERPLRTWLTMCGSIFAVFFICSGPWIFLLYQKYGFWTTGTAGRLNLSWYLIGHPFFREGTGFLLPPVYADSPGYWEDPYVINGNAPVFWSSPELFMMQIVRVGYNALKLNRALSDLSAFALPTFAFSVILLSSPALRKYFHKKLHLVALSILLFALPFLLINYEPRYIWFTYPLVMLTGALALEYLLPLAGSRLLRNGIIAVYALSFCMAPVWNLRPVLNEGKAEYEMAGVLKAQNIRGSFASNASGGLPGQRMLRLAYFSNNPYYTAPYPAETDADHQRLLSDLRRYEVKYYFYMPADPLYDTCFSFKDENGTPFPQVAAGRTGALKVFLLTPPANPAPPEAFPL